jgi:hypothetical protein
MRFGPLPYAPGARTRLMRSQGCTTRPSLGPLNGDIVIAGKGLDPVLVVGGPLAQHLFAHRRNANDPAEEVRRVFIAGDYRRVSQGRTL